MSEHGCLHFHIQNKNLYKTEQNKLIVQCEKKKLSIICQKQNSRINIGLIQIVAHLKRFFLTSFIKFV
jgi:uncharacterized protein (DUF1015 family)